MDEVDESLKAAASRICAACGLCCNGALFFSARLQPGDSARQLAALGLKIKQRADGPHLLQPCTAHQDNCCSVYEHRPTRCRAFNCRQITALLDGKLTEDEAIEMVLRARRQLDKLEELLAAAGETRRHKALSTRCDAVFIPPLNPAPEAEMLREEIKSARRELEQIFAAHFYLP